MRIKSFKGALLSVKEKMKKILPITVILIIVFSTFPMLAQHVNAEDECNVSVCPNGSPPPPPYNVPETRIVHNSPDMIEIEVDCWHTGHCWVCDEYADYDCSPFGWYGGYTEYNFGIETPWSPCSFSDPVPSGNIVTKIEATVYAVGCPGWGGTGSMYTEVLVNEQLVGGGIQGGDCGCGTCYPLTVCSPDYPDGFPSYVYGGTNQLMLEIDGVSCISDVHVRLYYSPPPVAPKILPVPYYHQGDTDWCAPTSMSMILNYYGRKYIHPWDIAEVWGWGRDIEWWRFWEPTVGMTREYFEECGLTTEDGSISFDSIKRWIDRRMPVIAWVSWWEVERDGLDVKIRHINHAVVIVGYNTTGGLERVYINDPGGTLVFEKMGLSAPSPIAVEARWSEVAGDVDRVMAVGGDEPSPPKGTIDIIDVGGFYFRTAEIPIPLIYSWRSGRDGGIIWKHEPLLHPSTLSQNDLFRFDRFIANQMEDEQTYLLEVKFLGGEVTEDLPPVEVRVGGRHRRSGVMEDSVPLQDLLERSGRYTVALTLWDIDKTEKYDEIWFPSIWYSHSIHGVDWFELSLCSSADLYVTDPLGLHVGVDPSTGQVVNEIPGAIYTGPDSDPQIITIPDRMTGDYLINVIPHPDASPTDTYTLEIRLEGISVVLAEDVQISDIPSQPYVIESVETMINVVPVADANDPYEENEGSPITFDGSGSYDPDGYIVLYEWDFDGDGTYDFSSTSSTATFTWEDDYTGTVTLRVTDDDGLASTDTAEVTVNNLPPEVEAGPDQTAVCGDVIFFDGSFTDPSLLDTHTVEWDFGDGTAVADFELAPTHIYYDKGVYTVTLKVTDDDGGVGTDTLEITVQLIPATIDLDPDTLNLSSQGRWITVYIELPEGYDVGDIDISTVELSTENEAVSAQPMPAEVGDHDGDGIPDLMVKFDRQAVIEAVDVGDRVVVAVTGKIFYDAGYAHFGGSDTIRVMEKGKGK